MANAGQKDMTKPEAIDFGAGQSRMELKDVSKGFGEEWDFDQVLGNLSLELETGHAHRGGRAFGLWQIHVGQPDRRI